MENRNEHSDQFRQSQQGTGSAENKGEPREVQKNPSTDLDKQEKTNIAGEMGQGPNPLTDIRQMGGMSGRDDSAGGSGDQMSRESTGEETER